MKLINVGFGNFVSDLRIVSVILPDSAPVKRLIAEARQQGMLVDATYGRKTQSVIITDSEHVVLSALSPDVIAQRNDSKCSGKLKLDTGGYKSEHDMI